jgi:argininosuccinate lyase
MTGMVGDLQPSTARRWRPPPARAFHRHRHADWLVRVANMPFRDAHHITGRLVENSVKSRVSYGGTAPQNVLKSARSWSKRLEKERSKG